MTDNSIFHRLQIIKIIPETKDAKTFVLKQLNNRKLEYKPGQFITLIFDTPFGEKRRSYSISSSPGLDNFLEITVKRMDNGEFSRHLIDDTIEGEIITSSGIAGFFCLPENSDSYNNVFFLAAGSGITPCFSLIRSLLESTEKKIILIYSNKSENQTIFYDSLNALQNKYSDRFIIKYLFSASNIFTSKRLNKEMIHDILVEHLSDIQDKNLFYVCGPFEYIRMIVISLISEGISNSKIKRENFNYLVPVIQKIPPDTDEHLVTINIHDSSYHLNVRFPQTILSVAKKNSIHLPYSCETGRCGSCAAICTKGKIWMSNNEVLTDKEIQEGYILTCQGFPVDGDAEIIFSVVK